MNLSELRWRTRELAGLAASDMDTTPPDIDAFLASAYREVLGLYDWPFLYLAQPLQTVAGQGDYDLAAMPDIREVRGVLDGQADPPVRLRPRTSEALDTLEGVSGRPEQYALVAADVMRLHPTPDAAYVLTVEATRDVLGLEVSEPVFAEDFHEMLAYIAGGRILRRRRSGGDVGRANDLDAEAKAFAERMRFKELSDHDRTSSVVGGRHRATAAHRLGVEGGFQRWS